MSSHRIRPFVLALSLAALLAPAGSSAAADAPTVLGTQGELVTVEHLSWGAVIGDPEAAGAADSVLALHIRRPDGSQKRVVIPETVGPDVERTAALLYEDATETYFVAWESVENVIHSQIRLIGYHHDGWTEPIDVSDSRFSLKSDPQLAVTRDSFEVLDQDGQPSLHRRTALHVVWTEERAEGLTVAYSPLVLIDGAHDAPGPIFALTDLVSPPEEEVLAEPLRELPLPATVRPGSDSHSVVIGFVHPLTGSLVSVDLALLSGEISSLADEVRAHIIESGREHNPQEPGQVQALAGIVRAHIIESGHRLEPGIRSFIADEIRAHIIESGREYDFDRPGDVQSFSEVVRAHIIESGFHLEERGLQRSVELGAARVLDFEGGEGAISHQVSLGVTAARTLETLSPDGRPIVLLSPTGGEALVAWQADGELRYQESEAEGWSEPVALSLEGLGLVQALAILEHRIENR